MSARPIIIDCDPGHDDAVMLLLALASPQELDVLGITTVAGNVPLALTQRNVRLVCELAGRSEARVFAGCARPLVGTPLTAETVHGTTGIDGLDIHEPALPLEAQHGVDFIVETLIAAEDNSITLVPTGPLTNIAMALVKEPRIAPKIREIVLMGGAWREGGNVTPSAEFNMRVDPHAAHVVVSCGRPLVVIGARRYPPGADHARAPGPARRHRHAGQQGGAGHARVLQPPRYKKYGAPGAPLHDPLTIAYLLRPRLFIGKTVNIAIETVSDLTMGATVVDFWSVTDRAPNALWTHRLDADGFFALLIDRLSRL